MGLRLERVSFRGFRSYESFELEKIGALTILVGPNAAGKTNVVEGIELLTALTSFRHPRTQQLILWGRDRSRLEARLVDEGRVLDVSLDLRPGSRGYQLNGKPRRSSDLRGLLPAVCFTPDDLELAKGSNQVKRTALDELGSQLSKNYHAVRRDYEKILKQKNRLLKEGASPAFRASVDDVLVSVGSHLTAKRHEIANRLRPYVQDYYRSISGDVETVSFSYVPSWIAWNREDPLDVAFSLEDVRRSLSEALAAGAVREEERRRSLWGPHADAIEFFVDGKNAAQYASQGQQRSLVLAFKLAEVALVQEMTGQRPILLLDDVMSELDGARRQSLVEFIEGDIQTVITTTNLDYFTPSLLDRARIIRLGKQEASSRIVDDSKEETAGGEA